MEIKSYNVTINETIFFDQLVKNDPRADENIRNGHGDDYTTCCLPDNFYLKNTIRL